MCYIGVENEKKSLFFQNVTLCNFKILECGDADPVRGGVNIPDILPKNNHEIEDDLDRCDQKGIIKS